MTQPQEIEARLSQLEEESLAAENRTLEDFPEILLVNLWAHYTEDGERGITMEKHDRKA